MLIIQIYFRRKKKKCIFAGDYEENILDYRYDMPGCGLY